MGEVTARELVQQPHYVGATIRLGPVQYGDDYSATDSDGKPITGVLQSAQFYRRHVSSPAGPIAVTMVLIVLVNENDRVIYRGLLPLHAEVTYVHTEPVDARALPQPLEDVIHVHLVAWLEAEEYTPEYAEDQAEGMAKRLMRAIDRLRPEQPDPNILGAPVPDEPLDLTFEDVPIPSPEEIGRMLGGEKVD